VRSKVKESRYAGDALENDAIPLTQGVEAEKPPAWEMIEKGRYRPRRIRGSLLGRELG
jgi:hypothetical protein